nr:alpha/beta fold hydrolase [Aurantimonas sp. HBX-1]
MIRGFPSSSRTFRDVIPALAEVAFVIAPDMPGYGESETMKIPSFQAVAGASGLTR